MGGKRLHLLAAAVLLHSGAAWAQKAEQPALATSVVTYPAAFFAPSGPQTALDIVRLVPGFQLDLGDVGRRGFAGTAGNVVINGARPSSKSESLSATLSRIPASRVLRVEVGPGDPFGADFAGRSQVANLILAESRGINGTAEVSVFRIFTGRLLPDAKGTLVVPWGKSTFNISAGTGRNDYVDEGTDEVFDVATGELFEVRRKFNRYYQHDPYAAVSWALEPASDRAIRLNARYSADQFNLVQTNRVLPVGEPERDDRLTRDFGDPSFELGGDLTRPLAGGAVKLVGLLRRAKRDYREEALERPAPDFDTVGGFAQLQKARRGETLVRASWSRGALLGLSVEAGGEAVLNTLRSRLDLFELDGTGKRVRIDLPVDDAEVGERRAELFAKAGRQISKRLRLDGGFAVELSRLRVRGDAEAERSLRFWKPYATLDWRGGRGWHALLSIKRTVAQLDFFDFVAAAELLNDRVRAGNPDLEPQRAWEVQGTLDRTILGDGLLKLEAGLDRIARLQDRVLTDEGFDAPGNLGTGRRRYAALTIDAPLSRFGIPGGRLELSGQLQRTRVRDPIDGKLRKFSGDYPGWQWQAEFRRDVGRWSYGATARDEARTTNSLTDEFDSFWDRGVSGSAFLHYRPDGRTTLMLDADNLFNKLERRRRLFFFPNRTVGEPEVREERFRREHRSFGFTIKRQLGKAGQPSE